MLSVQEDIKIYKYYLGEVEIGRPVKSILPNRKDDNPSFGLFKSKSGRIYWKDFAKVQDGTDAISLIRAMEGLSSRAEAYDFYYKKIKSHVEEEVVKIKITQPKKPSIILKSYYDINDYAYWFKRYQTIDILREENIFAGKELRWENYVSDVSTTEDPIYFYVFNTNPLSFKMYRPLSKDKKKKWKSYNIDGIIEGYDTLPQSHNSLIIASSTKDRLAWKIAHGAVINPTSESSWRHILEKINEFYERFTNIYCIFDNDEAGIKSSRKLEELSGGKIMSIDTTLFTPKSCKDIDDIVVKYGASAPYRILKKLNIIN